MNSRRRPILALALVLRLRLWDAPRPGDIYVSDPRFTAAYDDIEPGFSQYVHDAIYANSARECPRG